MKLKFYFLFLLSIFSAINAGPKIKLQGESNPFWLNIDELPGVMCAILSKEEGLPHINQITDLEELLKYNFELRQIELDFFVDETSDRRRRRYVTIVLDAGSVSLTEASISAVKTVNEYYLRQEPVDIYSKIREMLGSSAVISSYIIEDLLKIPTSSTVARQ